VFTPDNSFVLPVRLKITPNVKESYICNHTVDPEQAAWPVSDGKITLKLGALRTLPWKPKYRDTFNIEFAVQDSSNFSTIEKRELPEPLRVQLAVQAHIADNELLWPHDQDIHVHGTLGSDALRMLEDQKKLVLEPGLRIRSTRLGDYMYGSSHTCRLPATEISKKLGEFYANKMYIEMAESSHVKDNSLPAKDDLFFPEFVYSQSDSVASKEPEASVATNEANVVPDNEEETPLDESANKDTASKSAPSKKVKETISFSKDCAQPGHLTNDELNKRLRMVMDQQMQEFKEWDLTQDEHNARIMEEFRINRKRMPDGRYQVCLPWNEKTDQVSCNEKLALDRLKSLTRQFRKDPEFHGRYKQAVQELIDLKVIVKVDMDFVKKAKKAVFFPHHCVHKPDRITTQDRVVWDGSAHEKGKEPINAALEEGPNLLPPLQSMLMICRQGKYLVTGDLKKAFFQVALDPNDKILLFMYWYELNEETNRWEFTIYWFVRLPWGLNCSPFILQAAIRFHGQDHLDRIGPHHEDYQSLVDILKSLYIDDLIKPEDLYRMVRRVIEIAKKYLEDGGWELVKLRTNCKEVNDLLGIDSTSVEGIKILKQRVLGIIYDIMDDTLKPNVANIRNIKISKQLTRRTALSAFSSMYDPLRLFAPWLFTGQLLFQKTLRYTHDWDTVLNVELQDEWADYLESHNVLENVSINREAVPFEEDFEVHIFADACGDGYATVAYSVWKERNESNILIAMTRIVPDKLKESTTINRLELNGAVLATLIAKKIQLTFYKVKVTFTFWLDSMVTLWWIHGNKTNYQIYVTNRVRAILESTEASQWRHVPGKLNPADHASRGINAEKMKELKEWFHGPEFLLDESQWPPEFNKSTKPSAEVAMAMFEEEIPSLECLSLDPMPDVYIKALVKQDVPLANKPATFAIQVGNSPLEREIPRTPHRSKLYTNVVKTIVYLSRSWSHKQKLGMLQPIIEQYKLTNDMANEPFKKEWDIWKKALLGHVKAKWVEVDSLDMTRWKFRDKEKFPNPLTCKIRTEYVEKVNPPPHHRTPIDPAELLAAEEILIRDVQKHYFSAIYNALLEIRQGKPAHEAYKRLTPEDKKMVDKHQIMMDHREILVAVGRFITPSDKDITEENKRAGFHRDLVHVMEQYFRVSLGRPPATDDPQVYSWDDSDNNVDIASADSSINPKKRKPDWLDERTNKWLAENSTVTRVLILMPNRGLVSESIMRQAHNNSGHAGVNYTMRIVNQKFWIVKSTKLYNHVKTTCFMCRFFANKLWQIQEGLLPNNKIIPTKPFQFVGIDIAGPLFLKTPDIYRLVSDRSKAGKEALLKADPTGKLRQDPAARKYYVLLIVCATTRAVNFQLMEDMTAESIIPAFETFVHEKGVRPSFVLSDNAADFERTNNILQKAIRDSLSKTYADVKWVFIPSRAPWWGGQYEIFVRLMKNYLWKCMPHMRVTSVLQAVHWVKAAQGCINNRPLYIIPSGINDLEVSTPNTFNNVEFNIEAKYFPFNIDLSLHQYKQMKLDQSKQLKEMWQQFHQEYLTQMRAFHCRKGCFSKKPIKVGDIVLIKKDQVARNFWPIAKVVKIIPSKDGRIRKVMVQKYLPFAINAKLRKAKNLPDDNQSLTADQIRELTGYFDEMRHTQVVDNLVPFELWKGEQAEPEDMDTGQVKTIEVTINNTRIKGSATGFYAMGYKRRPETQLYEFNELPSESLRQRPSEKWTSSESFDEDLHQDIMLAWEIEDQ
jgi:hypothetical protein